MRRAKQLKFDASTVAFKHVERVRPYAYRPARYSGTFLSRDVTPEAPSQFPARAFVVWTGDNDMSPNRQANVDRIRTRIGLPVELVTPATLPRWIVSGHPLPEAYEHLSLIHRSDYLRGYLMHHHGGAYVDVKEPLGSWRPSWERMSADPEAWVTSYRASHANWIGKLRGRLGLDILVHYRLMFGKGGFMMRSHTPLTAAWLAQMDAVLTSKQEALARHPGGVFGDDADYPVSWTDLLGRILDPLTLKHLEHVRHDDRMLLRFEDYR
ncbi:glycosyltransferase family 32 protein [Nocardioides renjunii]|uniref:hypothetical protein n=1 Tax=Nocardioides renjunii TaxID=3095075 RepID=UPI002AFE2BA7|nr:hypothetical protein [Nocardioides sp. S-34]WQQ21791.1 hypothetical protein SHK17_18085 [Nocardioides sp. S-34]